MSERVEDNDIPQSQHMIFGRDIAIDSLQKSVEVVVVDELRILMGIRTCIDCAYDHFLGLGFFQGRGRRGLPDRTIVDSLAPTAQPVPFTRIELRFRLTQNDAFGEAAARSEDHGAVLGQCVVDVVGRNQAAGARLVWHDDRRVARDMTR